MQVLGKQGAATPLRIGGCGAELPQQVQEKNQDLIIPRASA